LAIRARASSAWRFFFSSSSARVFSLLREIISRMSSGVSCCCAAGLFVSRTCDLISSPSQPALPSISEKR
jgi:hypothetical protein